MSKEKPSFKQQNLPAWQPILTAGTVLPAFFLIGIAFVPIGIGLLMVSHTVQEIAIDYTDCSNNHNQKCHEVINQNQRNPPPPCTCLESFTVEKDYHRTVYAYYGLSNFYQNHRRYVRSRDDYQLLGHPDKVNKDCFPFELDRKSKKPIAPCGAIANSLFNDTFDLKMLSPQTKNLVIIQHGIAWATDKKNRYKNPPANDSFTLAQAFADTAKPPNWRKEVWQLSYDSSNNGFQNEQLIVWMRTAALPTFRKLYGILNPFSDNNDLNNNQIYLPKGVYQLGIDYNYPVKMFNGRKRFILSDTSCMGGKNDFLGIAYIIVGSICFVLSAIFLFIHKRYGRLSSEIIQINQHTQYLST